MDKSILKLHKKISSLEDFSPSREVNQVFSSLVNLATKFDDIPNSVFSNVKSDIQNASAHAETEMEIFWAKKIIQSKNPVKTLKTFWYYKNYLDLTKLEFGTLALCEHHAKHKKVLFVGSGPLPLTAIFLSQLYNCQITLLDKNQDSIKLSQTLVNRLNINNVTFVVSDVINFKDFNKYDTIIFAAMVEDVKISKEEMITKIGQMVKKGTHILVRSSFHNRELLYKKVDVKKIKGLGSVLEVRPKSNIVNSFHVFEK